ncbi:MAG: hypothetical protein ACXVBZ_15515 [Flavisolibacter sp.]
MSIVNVEAQVAQQASSGEALASWTTAIGTLLAVITAIILSVAPQIATYLTRPIFKVDFKNEEPYCRNTMEGYWIRLRVVNSGKSVAKNCMGKMVRIIDASTKQARKDFDPIVLRWVGSTIDKPIDINRNEDEYLDIIQTNALFQKQFLIRAAGVETDPPGINLHPPRKNYFLHIELYGANVEPKFVEVELRDAKEDDEIRATIREMSSFKK